MTLTTGINHLLLLIHGIHGKPTDWLYYEKNFSKPNCLIFIPKFAPWLIETHNGIDWCANQILELIISNTFEGAERLSRDYRISIFGHSLGGVIARYLVGLLEANDFFDIHVPVNFVTFSSPHLGALDYHSLLQGISSVAGGTTGSQIMLRDYDDEKDPLLLELSTPNSTYIKGLKKFQNKTLYSNITGDLQVGYCTSALVSINPYSEMIKNIKTDEKCVILGDLTDLHEIDLYRNNPDFMKEFLSDSSDSLERRFSYLEQMIRNMNKILWRRVDIWFAKSFFPFYINPHASIIIHSDWSVYHFAKPIFDHVINEHDFE